jgi:antitoxin (DNA-binding transcriptional repressor) of toxin-antitoxin stability system
MEIVTIHTAKTALSQLLARVEAGGEVTLSRGKSPIAEQGFIGLPATVRIVRRRYVTGVAPRSVRPDVIAQAMLDNLVLISNEQPFDAYGVKRLWRPHPTQHCSRAASSLSELAAGGRCNGR